MAGMPRTTTRIKGQCQQQREEGGRPDQGNDDSRHEKWEQPTNDGAGMNRRGDKRTAGTGGGTGPHETCPKRRDVVSYFSSLSSLSTNVIYYSF
jgi:hypothetical protein